MVENHVKGSFIVTETLEELGDHGDNDWQNYDMVAKVSGQSEEARQIARVHVASVRVPFEAPDGDLGKHPQLSKCLDISKGDLLIAEWYRRTLENGPDDVLRKADIISLGLAKNGSFRRLRGISLEWLFLEMVAVADRKGIPLQPADTWVHSSHVYQYAVWIAGKVLTDRVAKHMGKAYTNDFERGLAGHLLEKACFAHDFGRMYTGSSASTCIENGILHGYRGAQHFRDLALESDFRDAVDDLELLARVCERHIGGAGLTKSSVTRHPAFEKLEVKPLEMLAETLYEKIIGYADWRTHATKVGAVFVPTTVSESVAMNRSLAYNPPPDQISAVENLCRYIHDITNGQIPK